MKKIMSKSVAITYSLLGRKGKKKFGVLKVYSAIIGKINMFHFYYVCIDFHCIKFMFFALDGSYLYIEITVNVWADGTWMKAVVRRLGVSISGENVHIRINCVCKRVANGCAADILVGSAGKNSEQLLQ